jgi:hypothetical protein
LAQSPARKLPAGPVIIWRKATAITDIRRDNTFRSIRALAIETDLKRAPLLAFALPADKTSGCRLLLV